MIQNKCQQHTITVTKAKSITEKIVGLIGKKHPYPLFLETRWGIHTFQGFVIWSIFLSR